MREEVRSNLKIHLFFKNLIVLAGVLAIVSGCDKELAEIDENKVLRKLSVQEQELIHSTNSLSIDILRASYLQKEDENCLFSPVSVGMALGMIYNGVGEIEKSQIRRVMGLESLIEKEINKSYNELLSFLQVSHDQMDISYANSLWFSSDIDINEDFRTRVMAYYDAEISELNLAKPSAINFINNWGNLKTNGNFEELIRIAPAKNTDIFLINAFSMNSGWKQNSYFFQTKRDFISGQGKKEEINTINWSGLNVKFGEAEDYSFVEIPFEKDQFYLSVVQPDEVGRLANFMESFTFDELSFMTENALEFRANISLPKINFSSEKPLKSTLSSIGLDDLFLSTTDLSPSFEQRNKQISEINHAAKINVQTYLTDYESEVVFGDTNLKSISIDRPFLYFVRDKHTKTVLFAGFFTEPENQ